ncbi:hypothetical protein MAR_021784 [Mya arenaria]|uniref:Uncharacterized protein n=1 Tax=Mya arenaria TaxID=6604 RepID=A0ABY7EBN2_MYAAR|nr:hypothetical protein MAR_021784 [Mya arenaria]
MIESSKYLVLTADEIDRRYKPPAGTIGYIAGGTTGGIVAAIILMIVVVIVLRRKYNFDCLCSFRFSRKDNGDHGPDNLHVYTPLAATGSKTQVYYENVKDDPVYNNTVLKNPIQSVL